MGHRFHFEMSICKAQKCITLTDIHFKNMEYYNTNKKDFKFLYLKYVYIKLAKYKNETRIKKDKTIKIVKY